MTFAFPWAFVALLVWFFLPRSTGWGWRFAASFLLLAALAQPAIEWGARSTVVLVEVSEAVGTNALEQARSLPLDEFGAHEVVVFARSASGTADLHPPPAVVESLRGNGVDLATALSVAAAREPGRIALFGSGIDTSGGALQALPEVPVDVRAVAAVDNARIVTLTVPSDVGAGESFDAVATIELDREAEVTLRPSAVGAAAYDEEPIVRTLPAGRHALAFGVTAGDDAAVRVRAQLEVDFEQPTGDDAREATVEVREPLRVLVLNDPALAGTLRQSGFDVTEGDAASLRRPLEYAVIAVRGEADAFTRGQQELLADFATNGGGLLMTGGAGSFGLSGWFRTPVEDVLPVNTEVPDDEAVPSVAIVIVLDRSGSMRAERPSRMSVAQRGALDLVDNARPSDLIGLVAFDHSYEWIFRPRAATERGKSEMRDAILRVAPEGGTIIGPAYRSALEELRDLEAATKHIIIVSDGEFFDGTGRQGPPSMGPRPDFEALAAEGVADGITTTTIGIGEADFVELERIANSGEGRFFGVTDLQDLPRILTGELSQASRTLIREGPFVPAVRPHPLTLAVGEVVPVGAYIASVLREGSELLVEGEDGEAILAVRRVGLGRTAALTTDLNVWAGAWSERADSAGLLAATVRWLGVTPQPFSVSLLASGNELEVVVDAVRDGEYLDGERLEARYAGGTAVLAQVGPGRYAARLPLGTGTGDVVVSTAGRIVSRQSVAAGALALDAGGGAERLHEIARRTGGVVITDVEAYVPERTAGSFALWPFLAAAGLLLFLLELVARRLPASWRDGVLRRPDAAADAAT